MDMENPSFYDVFERMWKHVLTKLDNFVLNENFNHHVEDENNPHRVTAEQAGALPITGGTMENTIILNGVRLTAGIDYGSGDPGDGVVGQLYFKKVT
jgi:hypothetical protein